MIGQPWVMYPLDCRIARQELRDFHCIFTVGSNSPGQGPDASLHQPAVKGRGDCAGSMLNHAHPLKKVALFFGDNNPAKDVGVASEIFRSRMVRDVDT